MGRLRLREELPLNYFLFCRLPLMLANLSSGTTQDDQVEAKKRREAGHQLAKEAIIARLQSYGRDGGEPQEEESLFVADLGETYRQCRRWASCFPNVTPFYAVKCNDDPVILAILVSLGAGFDCASLNELKTVLELGVDPSRIIYAAPCKASSHIRFAAQHGVRKIVFDNEEELRKIARLHPDPELYLRIHADDPSCKVRLAEKFGATPDEMPWLLQMAMDLRQSVVGVSFHVGSSSSDPQAFARAVQDARCVYDQALRVGFTLQNIDIGGGFTDANFETSAIALSSALHREFGAMQPALRIIAEPGRFLVSETFSLACKVIGLRSRTKNMLYLNDGVYGNFMNALIEPPIPTPSILDLRTPSVVPPSPKKLPVPAHKYTIWGRTCDGTDRIINTCGFHRPVRVDDWLFFKQMGGGYPRNSAYFPVLIDPGTSIYKRMRNEVQWVSQRNHYALCD